MFRGKTVLALFVVAVVVLLVVYIGQITPERSKEISTGSSSSGSTGSGAILPLARTPYTSSTPMSL